MLEIKDLRKTNDDIIEIHFCNAKQCRKVYIKLLKCLHKTLYKEGVKEVRRLKGGK